MKKWIALILLVFAGGSVVAQNYDLFDEVDALRNAVYRKGNRIPEPEKQRLAAKINDITSEILYGDRPARGYYCTAACKRGNGEPDLNYSKGAEGSVELQAKNAAREEVRKSWSCTYGVVDVECSEMDGVDRFCVASCKRSNGDADLRYAGGGRGRSESEARDLARADVRRQFSCAYGIVDYDCSASDRPAYCVAACSRSNGEADLNYSKGAEGEGRFDAAYNAIQEVRKGYSCNYGVVISECSESSGRDGHRGRR